VALRGEVDDGIDRMVPEDGSHGLRIADITPDKGVVRVASNVPEILQIPGVGQCVKVDDSCIGVLG